MPRALARMVTTAVLPLAISFPRPKPLATLTHCATFGRSGVHEQQQVLHHEHEPEEDWGPEDKRRGASRRKTAESSPALVRLGLLIRLSHTACSGQQQETSLPGQAWERIMQKNSELIEECQPRLCFQIIQHIDKIALLSSSCPSPIVTLVHNYGRNYDHNHSTMWFYSVVL